MTSEATPLLTPRQLGVAGLRSRLMLGLVLPALVLSYALPSAGVPLSLLGLLVALIVPVQIRSAPGALSPPADLAGKVRAQGPAGLGSFTLIPDGVAFLTADALVWLPLNGNLNALRQIRLAGASVGMPRFPMLPGLRVLHLENAEDSLTLCVGERDQWVSRIRALQAEVGVMPWLPTAATSSPADAAAPAVTNGSFECRACATRLPEQARFCWQCGAHQTESPAPAPAMPALSRGASALRAESSAPMVVMPTSSAEPMIPAADTVVEGLHQDQAEIKVDRASPPSADASHAAGVRPTIEPVIQVAVAPPEALESAHGMLVAKPAIDELEAQGALPARDEEPSVASSQDDPGAVPGSALTQTASGDSLVDRATARLTDLETRSSQLTAETLDRIRKTIELTAWVDTDLDQVERVLRAPSADGPVPAYPELKGKAGKRRKAKA